MLQVTPKLQDDVEARATKPVVRPLVGNEPAKSPGLRVPSVRLAPTPKENRPQFHANSFETSQDMQTRVPVIIGEVSFRGTVPVDGIICGSPGASGGSLSVRQRGRTFFGNEPELNGDIAFRDMLRVNGHIAGSVCSKKGTLIVDATAQIDANIEVSVAVIGGTVNGDIVAHQRVELGPAARIHGNIWTRSLAIQNGAIFDGICQMIEEKDIVS
jgi:cytoskeletal protein CcmA (bactofilin family)